MPKIREKLRSALGMNPGSSSTPVATKKHCQIVSNQSSAAAASICNISEGELLEISGISGINSPIPVPAKITLEPIEEEASLVEIGTKVAKISDEFEIGPSTSLVIIDDFDFVKNPDKEKMANKSLCEEHKVAGKQPSKVAVGIFYDIENIPIPSGVTPAEFITAVRKRFAEGPGLWEKVFLAVTWFRHIPHKLEKQLYEYHVEMVNIPRVKDNVADNALRTKMHDFIADNKFARVVLISGDSDFSRDIHDFKTRHGSEVILIHNKQAKASLLNAASEAHLAESVCEPKRGDIKVTFAGKADVGVTKIAAPFKRTYNQITRVLSTEKPRSLPTTTQPRHRYGDHDYNRGSEASNRGYQGHKYGRDYENRAPNRAAPYYNNRNYRFPR